MRTIGRLEQPDEQREIEDLAVGAKKKIRKSGLESEVKARCLAEGKRKALVSGFNCLCCLDGVDVDEIVAHSEQGSSDAAGT